MLEYNEKRDYYRMNIDCEARLSQSGSGSTEIVQIADLSATGMRLISPSELAADEIYNITITPRTNITPPLNADIVVLRCDEKGGEFHIAATIKEIYQEPEFELEAQSA